MSMEKLFFLKIMLFNPLHSMLVSLWSNCDAF